MKIVLSLSLAAAVSAAVIPSAPAAAQGRPARCVVSTEGFPTWRGPCRFEAERGGSFTVTPPRGRTFTGGVTAISVAIEDPGVAEIRGLTQQGINSRWGPARRSRRDRACWVGEGFSVCAY